MTTYTLLPVALLLPLYPFSMLFNRLFARVDATWARVLLLAAWPTAGIALLAVQEVTPPPWIAYWAAFTALLYAFRSLALRDLGVWIAHLATSAWSLLWLVPVLYPGHPAPMLQLLAFGIPLLVLAWLAGALRTRFGAAYAGAPGGLAGSLPRLAGLLVLGLLAAIGTPLFPAFFAMLGMINHAMPHLPWLALALLLVWMLWAWSGMRMLQGLVVGPAPQSTQRDLGRLRAGYLGAGIALFTAGGLWLSGSLV